jgi:hypothetical protein
MITDEITEALKRPLAI